MANLSRRRLVDIDTAKGFAIFLVVLGHIVSGYGSQPENNLWYTVLRDDIIYKFHMPFFMYLSGIIFSYTYPSLSNAYDYLKYVFKKIKRLSVAYILFSALIYIGKTGLSSVIHVDRVPNSYYNEVYNLLFMPKESAGGSLWFVYVLMEMYIVFPLLLMLKARSLLLVITGIFLYFLKMPHYFLLDLFAEHFIFFAIGISVTHYFSGYLKKIDQYLIFLLTIFLLSFFISPYMPNMPSNFSKLVIGLCALPALHGMVRNKYFSSYSIWGLFGAYTFSIYLMNTIFIGIVKGLVLKFTTWNDLHFLIIAPILLLSGIYFPIFIKRYIFVKIPVLDRATT